MKREKDQYQCGVIRAPFLAVPPHAGGYMLWVMGLCMCGLLAAAQPLGNAIMTGGTSYQDSNGRFWAYMFWQATDPTLLQGRSIAVYRKDGTAGSANPYTKVAVVARRTDAATIGSLLDRSVNLGEDLNVLGSAVDSLFDTVIPPGNLTLAQKLSAILNGGLSAEQADHLSFLGHTHPGIGLCLGVAYAELAQPGDQTFELRDWDSVKQQDLGVLGRVTVTGNAPLVLPAPGGPVLVPDTSPKGDLHSKLRWATPDDLRRLSLMNYGFNLYRIDRQFAENYQFQTTPPVTAVLLALTQSNPDAVKRVNDAPVLPNTGFSSANVADFNADPADFFIADDNGRFDGGIAFTNGAQFYYFVTARDILGRDGVVSSGTLVTVCDRMPPPPPTEVEVVNDYTFDGINGLQALKVVWAQNVNDTNETTVNYYVYRWNSITEMHLNAGNPLSHRIAGPIAHVPNQEQNSYVDTGLASPSLPADAGKTFWYTVRAEDNGACGANLSGNSGPAYGVLRDREGPAGPSGSLSILCLQPVAVPSPPVTDTNNPLLGPDLNNFHLVCTRTNNDIAWAEFSILPAIGSNVSVPLVAFDSDWRYDQSGSNYGTTWKEVGYDDSAWGSGQSLLGYDDSPGRFPVPFRTILPPRPGGGPVTTYFRTHFNVPPGMTALTLTTSNLVDDGAVFYLNGIEVGRLRVPQPTTYTTVASRQTNEGQIEVLNFPIATLAMGDNVLAVEVHQVYATNRDTAFGMSLTATGQVNSNASPASIRRIYFPPGQSTVAVDYSVASGSAYLPTFSCVAGTASGRASTPAVAAAGWPPRRNVRQVAFRAWTQAQRIAPGGDCLVHDPRRSGSGTVEGVDITILTNATAREFRIYRVIDDGPLMLIAQGEIVRPAMLHHDDSMPLNACTICYFGQLLDEHGNAGPLVKFDPCITVAGTIPTPILAPIAAANASGSPQMTVKWFCPPYAVQRFEVWISTQGQTPADHPSPSLSRSNTAPITSTVQVEGTNVTREFAIYRTPEVGPGFPAAADGATFQVTADIAPDSQYVVFVKAVAPDGSEGAASKAKAYEFNSGTIALPPGSSVPWPARALPPTSDSTVFNSGIAAKWLDLPNRFTGMGVRIGAVLNPVGTNVGTNNIILGTNAPAGSIAPTTASMDGGTLNTNYTWYEQGFNKNAPGTGLPTHGSVFTNVSAQDHTYRMAPSYTTNDALLIDQVVTNGTFTLTSPTLYGSLSFLASAGPSNAPVTVAYVVHYLDSRSESGSFTVADWFASGSAPAWNANGRARVGDLAVANVNGAYPKIFYKDVALVNPSAPITSISLSYVSGQGHACFLAVSGLIAGSASPGLAGYAWAPITVSGYNQDMIIETGATAGGLGPPIDIPATYLYLNGNGDPILPVTMYRYQVPNAAVPDVSGSLIQVTPLLEEIAFRNSSSYPGIELRDPFIALEWVPGALGPHQDIYLLDTQPAITQASYRYLLVRFRPDHEIDKVLVTQPVTAP